MQIQERFPWKYDKSSFIHLPGNDCYKLFYAFVIFRILEPIPSELDTNVWDTLLDILYLYKVSHKIQRMIF